MIVAGAIVEGGRVKSVGVANRRRVSLAGIRIKGYVLKDTGKYLGPRILS